MQKPKKPPEIQVWRMLVPGPLVGTGWGLGLGTFSALAWTAETQTFWLHARASGSGGEQFGSTDGNEEGVDSQPSACPLPSMLLRPQALKHPWPVLPRPCQLPWTEWRARTSMRTQMARSDWRTQRRPRRPQSSRQKVRLPTVPHLCQCSLWPPPSYAPHWLSLAERQTPSYHDGIRRRREPGARVSIVDLAFPTKQSLGVTGLSFY